MHERIKKLRKALELTQREFGERIGVKPNTIATYEIGRNEPIDAVISLICREFNVSKKWLRTGVGEMFVEKNRDDQIYEFINTALQGKPESFKLRLISAFSRLEEEDWVALEKLATKLAEKPSILDAEDEPTTTTFAVDDDIESKVNNFREELLVEKELKEKSQASQESSSSDEKLA